MSERPVELERLRHRAGEQLRSTDFRDQLRYEDELLAWHQRAVHDAYGVVRGLEVSWDGLHVEVAPGVAYDCAGHALTIQAARRVAVPFGATRPLTLVLRRGARGASELAWLPSSQADIRAGVALRTFDPHKRAGPLPVARRATTRVLAAPRIAAGTTQRGATAWEPWRFAPPGDRPRTLGVQVRVDTLRAGFTDTPCYFAWLRWPYVATHPLEAHAYRQLGHQYVEEEGATGFTFRVLMRGLDRRLALRAQATGGNAGVMLATTEELYVAWLGVQAEGAGCGGERKGDHGPA